MPEDVSFKHRLTHLKSEAEYFQRRYGCEVRIDEMDATWLYLSSFPLPPGWNKCIVQLLLDIPSVPVSYPQAALHGFWTDRDIQACNGQPMDLFLFSGASPWQEQLLLEKDGDMLMCMCHVGDRLKQAILWKAIVC